MDVQLSVLPSRGGVASDTFALRKLKADLISLRSSGILMVGLDAAGKTSEYLLEKDDSM